MKLYSVPLSPFVARVRVALRSKGLTAELILPPEGGTRSADFLAMNPTGKIPVLVTDDGLVIAESQTIIDFIDELVPEPPLMPAGAADRVQVRNVIAMLELNVTPALFRLFPQLAASGRDDAVVAAEMARLVEGLRLTTMFVSDGNYAVGNALSKADCLLAPTLLLVGVVAAALGVVDPVAAEPRLSAYYQRIREQPHVGAELEETARALAAMA